nr:hypothetical protein Iba_chr05eCG11050 [Ipomoea batatas]
MPAAALIDLAVRSAVAWRLFDVSVILTHDLEEDSSAVSWLTMAALVSLFGLSECSSSLSLTSPFRSLSSLLALKCRVLRLVSDRLLFFMRHADIEAATVVVVRDWGLNLLSTPKGELTLNFYAHLAPFICRLVVLMGRWLSMGIGFPFFLFWLEFAPLCGSCFLCFVSFTLRPGLFKGALLLQLPVHPLSAAYTSACYFRAFCPVFRLFSVLPIFSFCWLWCASPCFLVAPVGIFESFFFSGSFSLVPLLMLTSSVWSPLVMVSCTDHYVFALVKLSTVRT